VYNFLSGVSSPVSPTFSPHIFIQNSSAGSRFSRPEALLSGGRMQPVHLRTAIGAKSCANCIMYKSLDDYKNLIRQFGPASPLVQAYGYGPEYLEKDGICEMEGDPPVMKSDVCDSFLSF
jgi:hypothetical protein